MNRRDLLVGIGATSLAGWPGAAWAEPRSAYSRHISRGGRLLVLPDRGLPVVRMVLGVPVGTLSRGFHDQPMGWAWRLQLPAAHEDVRDALSKLGAWIRFSVDEAGCWLQVECLSESAEAVVEQVALVVRKGFDDFYVDSAILQRQMAETWKAQALMPSVRLGWAVDHICFDKGDPRLLDASPPRVQALQAHRLRSLRDRLVRHPRRVLGFAGDLTPELALKLGGILLPQAESKGGLPETGVLPLKDPREDAVTYLFGLETAWIGLAAPTLTWEDPDSFAVWVLDTVLRRRLVVRLRDKLGAAYTLETSSPVRGHQDVYRITVPTRFKNLEATVAAMSEELDRMAGGNVEESERKAAMAATFGGLRVQWQSPMGTLMRLIRYEQHQSQDNRVDTLRERLAGLDLAALNRAAPFFARKRFAEVLLLPKG